MAATSSSVSRSAGNCRFRRSAAPPMPCRMRTCWLKRPARRQPMSLQTRRRQGGGGEAMRGLVTGHNGFIGAVMVGGRARAGHDVVGLDTYLFETCTFGPERRQVPSLRGDVRDVEIGD